MALTIDPALLGPDFIWRDGQVSVPMGSIQPIVAANPSRVLLVLSTATNGAFLRPNGNPTIDLGLVLPQNNPLIIKYADYGPVVGAAWQAFSQVTAPKIYWIELIFQPHQE